MSVGFVVMGRPFYGSDLVGSTKKQSAQLSGVVRLVGVSIDHHRLALVLVMLVACEDGGGMNTGVDGGAPGDDATTIDGGPLIDGAPGVDGMLPDAPPFGMYMGPTDGNRCTEDQWCPVEPSVPATLRAMTGWGPNDVWVAGEGGTLMHWDGTKFTRTPTGTRESFDAMWGSGPQDIWAIGPSSAAYHFNGSTWTRVSIPTLSYYAEAISGRGSNLAWIAGYDGSMHKWNGATWTKMTTATTNRLYSVYAASATDGWASGEKNTLLRWNGVNWGVWTPPSTDANTHYTSVWGNGPNDVWLTNGTYAWNWNGSTWTQKGYLSFGGYIKGMWGRAPNDVWSPGDGYNLDHWNGTEWTDVPHGLDGQGTIYSGLAGYSASANDVWFTTTYGGIAHGDGTDFAWVDFPGKPSSSKRGVWASGANDVWAVGDNGQVRRWNGTAWSNVTIPPAGRLNAIYGTSASNIYAVGDSGTILHYNGTAWTKITGIPTTTWHMYAVWASGPNDVYAIGHLGNLSHWNGSAWTSAHSGATLMHVYGLFGFGANDIWGAAEDGRIIHKTAAGWSTTTNGTYDLRAIWGAAPNDVWAVGDYGSTYHWNGTAWSAVPTPATADYANLRSIIGRSANDVYAVSESGLVYHWNGTAWSRQLSGTQHALRGVTIAGNKLFAVGDYGTILSR
jgi:hypothetical protein